MDPVEMLNTVDGIWRQRIRSDTSKGGMWNRSIMHNGVISIAPDFGDLITESGKDVDKMLLDLTHDVVRRWEELFRQDYNKKNKGRKLEKGEVKFGYIVGINNEFD